MISQSHNSMHHDHPFHEQGHTLGVVSVTTNATGEVAASSSMDSVCRVWNLTTHETIALIAASTTESWSVAFSPNATPEGGLLLAVAGGTRGAIVLWHVNTSGDSEASATFHSELMLPEDQAKLKKERFVLSVAYSPDGQKVACGCMDGTVGVFEAATGSYLGGCAGHYKPVRSLAFLPDGRSLLTACDDMHVNLYDVANFSLVDSFSGHGSWVLSVAAHPNGNAFVSGGSDAKVKLFDVRSRSCVQTLSDHTDQVWSVSFNSDGTRLATASDDKSILCYSVGGE